MHHIWLLTCSQHQEISHDHSIINRFFVLPAVTGKYIVFPKFTASTFTITSYSICHGPIKLMWFEPVLVYKWTATLLVWGIT